jgi:photosystem II stability/assembly factor-like uncharacterized protein
MSRRTCFVLLLTAALLSSPAFAQPSPEAAEGPGPHLKVGWVIGDRDPGTAVILHTDDGGRTWAVQGDSSRWPTFTGNDISAVDAQTAWAALGAVAEGMILHTTDGGATWREQDLPEHVGPIKQIKGLSRKVAWAVSLWGTVLRTTDGGETWAVIPHPTAPIIRVNRMDVRGDPGDADIRIVDEEGGRLGMIHSANDGYTWHQEWVNYPSMGGRTGLHMVGAHSKKVAWCSTWWSGELFRTRDGGDTWESVGTISGPNDLDDMASPTGHTLWTVQNLSGDSGGVIFHVRLRDGKLVARQYNPTHQHIFEGVTCSDDKHALVVGSRAVGVPTSVPLGVILRTDDGGKSWTNQPTPIADVAYWKVSFVGAWR